MSLVRLISWPYLRRHVLRSLVTLAGVTLGVTVFMGMHTVSDAVLHAFQQTVERVSGSTQLQVTASEAGFGEEVLERVQAVPEVGAAVPVIEAVVESGLTGEGSLMILAVDMTGDRTVREYDVQGSSEDAIEDPLVFLAQPDSLLITKELAGRHGLTIGARLPLLTMDGPRQFTVRGIMASGDLLQAYGGSIAVMDVYAAQKMFGRGRTFDRIDIVSREGVGVDECRRAVEAAVGPGLQVAPPSAQSEQFQSIVRGYSISVNVSSLLALFIGLFIIYNSFAIAVTERRYEIGMLRALGATRGQIRSLFLVEGAVMGAVGSALGLVAGSLLARAIAGSITGLLTEVYGVTERVASVSADTRLLATSFGIGLGASVLAAMVPARQAARTDPVRALQKGSYQVLPTGQSWRRFAVGIVVLAASVAVFAGAGGRWPRYTGYALLPAGALLLTPRLVAWLTRLLRPALRWMRPVEGTLAADSLLQAPRRTSGTVAALMFSVALVIAFAGVARGSRDSILGWVQTALNPDLFVTSSQNLSMRSFRFPAAVGDELRAIPHIERIQAVRSVRVLFRGSPVGLVSVDGLADFPRRSRRAPTAGDPEAMYRLTGEGRGVMVSDSLARLKRLHLGEVIGVPTPSGMLTLPIVGITIDYSDQQGSILIDRTVFARAWNDDSVTLFRVYVDRPEHVAGVRQQILNRLGGTRRLFVLTNDELRRWITRITDQWLGLTYAQIAIALLVAVLGIVNSLTVSIIDRRRELAVLQAVGGLRQQVRHTIWMEAITIGLVGLLLGTALGAANLYYLLRVMEGDVLGMHFEYIFPATIAMAMVPTLLLAAFGSALWPGESAVRAPLVEALAYE